QLDEMLRANGVTTKLTIVDDNKLDGDIRTELVENLQRRGDYIIIAFLREAVGERGGPHISPLGAYDAESDSFLILDVNPASADWVWMPTKTLIKGMRTFDKIENRGYILVFAAMRLVECPLWVKSRHVQCNGACPLHTRKRHVRCN